jgi:hypothetical protein
MTRSFGLILLSIQMPFIFFLAFLHTVTISSAEEKNSMAGIGWGGGGVEERCWGRTGSGA